MASKRSDSIDYTTQCTVLITFIDDDTGPNVGHRIVYERPQPYVPDGPLTARDRARILQYPTDDELTEEAFEIFADMKRNHEIGTSSTLVSVFIARTAAAALEMNL